MTASTADRVLPEPREHRAQLDLPVPKAQPVLPEWAIPARLDRVDLRGSMVLTARRELRVRRALVLLERQVRKARLEPAGATLAPPAPRGWTA